MNKKFIEKILPHGPSMCLLDEIVDWDQHSIHAQTLSHQDEGNPMLDNGKLHSINAIEYAAQAMAVHSVLSSDQDNKLEGFLASVHDVKINCEYMEACAGPISITCKSLMQDAQGLMYLFNVTDDETTLINGRILVMRVKK